MRGRVFCFTIKIIPIWNELLYTFFLHWLWMTSALQYGDHLVPRCQTPASATLRINEYGDNVHNDNFEEEEDNDSDEELEENADCNDDTENCYDDGELMTVTILLQFMAVTIVVMRRRIAMIMKQMIR